MCIRDRIKIISLNKLVSISLQFLSRPCRHAQLFLWSHDHSVCALTGRISQPGHSRDLGESTYRVVGHISCSSVFFRLAKSLNGSSFSKSLTDTQMHSPESDHHLELLWRVNLNSLYKRNSDVYILMRWTRTVWQLGYGTLSHIQSQMFREEQRKRIPLLH